jgi:hypothetical protein
MDEHTICYTIVERSGDSPLRDRFPQRKSLKEAKELAGKTFAARKDRPRKYNVQVVNEDTGHCYLVVR